MGAAFTVEGVRSTALRALNYTPEVDTLRRRRRGRETVRLGDLVQSMGPAYGSVFIRRDCDPEHGIELVAQSDMFGAEPMGRVIRMDSLPRPAAHRIERWQVLMAGAGTLGPTELYGRSILADNRLVGKFVGPDAMVLTFKEPGQVASLVTYAFLCSSVGVRAVRATSYGTKILRFRSSMIADLPIPLPEEEVQERVAALIRQTMEGRERYLVELRAARKIIEDLPEMQEAKALCGERRGRCVAWEGPLPTLQAWNFIATGSALSVLKRKWSARLRDLLEPDGIFNGPRFARVPCSSPHGVDFLSQRDVFMIRPIPRRIVNPGFDPRRLFVPANTLLLGSHGQLTEGSLFGRVEVAANGAHRCAITQDILRLFSKEGFMHSLYAFLSTSVGYALLCGTAVGTSIPSMRLDLLSDLPVPTLRADQLHRVQQHVNAAISARQAASTAEDEAVRIMETEVLPLWLA